MIKQVFRQMTAAQIVSATTITICLLVDSIVIGRLIGVEAMSAYGLASPVLQLFTALGTTVSVGAQVMIGDRMGRGDIKGCRSVYSTTIALSLIMSVLWLAVVFGCTRPLCVFLGAGAPSPDNRLFTMTGDYLRGYILDAPFYFLSQIMIPYLQVMGKRRLMVISTLVMTASDIIFDLLSVFVFHAGMFGIGLASSLSYLAAFLVGVGYFLQKDCLFRFESQGVDLRTIKQIGIAGSPVIIGQTCFVVRVYFINHILLAASGAVAVAAFSVISTMGTICFCIGLGAGSVTLMLSSIFWSEEDRSSLYELIRVMSKNSLTLITAAVLIVELAAPWMIRLFLGSDPAAFAIAVPGIRIYIISLIPCVIATVFKNYYQGIRHMAISNFISISNNVLLLIPCVWICAGLWGLPGIWIGVIAGETATLLAVAIIVWFKYGRISFSVEAFSYLDRSFGADPSNVFEMSVTDLDTAAIASSYINEFCKMKGLAQRVSMLVSLCVEEIVVNIIEHGFTKDDKPHTADLRLVVDETKCIVRIRDNCIGFDPTRYLELHKSNDPSAHIGIKIVMGMVNEVNYINSLGLNNLYMSILK